MKRILLTLSIAITILAMIFTGIKNAITSSEWYQTGKEIFLSFKEYSPPLPKIETYNDLVKSDIQTKDGVKRVNLDWTLFSEGREILEGTPIPDGYNLISSFDEYIQISPDHKSNIILPESKMIEFMKNTFLPSDVKFISHKAYFKKRHKPNGTDTDVGEYLYKSDASNLYYKISFIYSYIDRDEKSILNNYYSHATIDKEAVN